jgi:hypothetical protein
MPEEIKVTITDRFLAKSFFADFPCLDAAKLFNRISFSAHPVCHLAALAGKVCWRRRVVFAYFVYGRA